MKGFNADESFMKDFIKFGEDMDVEFEQEGYDRSGDYLKVQIKAWMARNLWDIEVIEHETMFDDWKIHY